MYDTVEARTAVMRMLNVAAEQPGLDGGMVHMMEDFVKSLLPVTLEKQQVAHMISLIREMRKIPWAIHLDDLLLQASDPKDFEGVVRGVAVMLGWGDVAGMRRVANGIEMLMALSEDYDPAELPEIDFTW